VAIATKSTGACQMPARLANECPNRRPIG
jgi:hypothetical protein